MATATLAPVVLAGCGRQASVPAQPVAPAIKPPLKPAATGAAAPLAAAPTSKTEAKTAAATEVAVKPTPVSVPTPLPAPTVVIEPTAARIAPTAKPVFADLPAGPVAPYIESAVWINSKPLAWDSLRGKVVMVEFWTFGCYNCRNVLPELKKMHADYSAQGLVIIGVHSPEFDYEKELANVKKAVKQEGVQYPVAIDNDFANWNRWGNRYWPSRTLVDKRGISRYAHIGEGDYGATRAWIEQLLAEG